MGKFTNNVVNAKQKELRVFNKNYFFLTTILFIGAMFLTYYCFEKQIDKIVETNKFYNIFLMVFRHGDLGHIVGNVISFFVVSLFLERHFGSLKYLFILIFAIPLSSMAVFLISGHFSWIGESALNYFLYALFVTVVLFNFKSYILDKWQNLFTFFTIGAICLIMCWCGSTEALTENIAEFFQFGAFTDLITNRSHWSGAIMGTLVGMFAGFYSLCTAKRRN